MMSLSEIRRLSDEQAAKAARKKLKPYVPFSREEIEGYPSFPFPNIGSYDPPGWERVHGADDPLFVDTSGFGSENEPALTVRQFKEKLLELWDKDSGYGYAIVSEGPFQAYIGIFKEKKGGSRRSRRKVS